jgi:hypothetical protein
MAGLATCPETATAVPPQPAAAVMMQTDTEIPVVDRFRTHSGPRTPDALAALVTGATPAKIRQQPLIALSDGSSALVVAIKFPPLDEYAPSFAFTGARLVSLERKQNDEWVLKAIPDKGVWQAALLIKCSAGSFEYPLVVAPPLPPETDLSEQGFRAFLAADRSAANSSPQDLNQDGQINYVDDFIYTANYLAKQSTSGTAQEARRQRALRRTLSAPNSIPPQALPKAPYDGVLYGEL